LRMMDQKLLRQLQEKGRENKRRLEQVDKWREDQEKMERSRTRDRKQRAEKAGGWCKCAVRPNDWQDILDNDPDAPREWDEFLMQRECPKWAFGVGPDRASCQNNAREWLPQQCRNFLGHCQYYPYQR